MRTRFILCVYKLLTLFFQQDYVHEIVCITEREKFVIPVQAIGARALLDFPDKINFPSAPVKHKSVKTILIRNIGTVGAKFSLDLPRLVTEN